ncbi:hypothetical protein C5Z26_06480 [Lactobacillus sp. CBA3606]|uniref:sensor domain-containing diguanylate cyclase n=1 Tax=Lactobacillus sp. CBA3606 TaxID=2099789 RepID=UPI000CFD6E5A|nr:diguanylate cyclase [Lactobacillus sp. CBA3606]AVK63773.1 hypothetical protein C5Z26_06480 [Lactobacillus sp. CBA3606]
MTYSQFGPMVGLIWIVQLMLACFFIVGYLADSTRIWNIAFHANYATERQRRVNRVLLTVMALAVGGMLHFTGYIMGPNAMMFHNMSLFVLVLSLLDDGINLGEYLLRVAGLFTVFIMHHMNYFYRPEFFIGLLFFIVMVIVVRRHAAQIHYSAVYFPTLMLTTGLVLWFTIPGLSGGMLVTNSLRIEAMLMFGIMTLFTFNYQNDVHEKTIENHRIEKMASYDLLTNTKNYSEYQQEIVGLFKAATKQHAPLTLAQFDIDHFKQVNDTYGHLAGNAVLVRVAKVMNAVLRDEQLDYQLYRTGGEEFTLAMPNQVPDDVLAAVKKGWDTIRKTEFDYENHKIRITISIGITQLAATDRNIDDTYRRADENLYQSKHAGRDAITVEGQTVIQAHQPKELVALYAFFMQKIVAMPDFTDYRHELLLRIYDSRTEKWILPDSFEITVATQIALMQHAMQLNDERCISLNLTLAQFTDPEVAQQLATFNQGTDRPDSFTVELTEVPAVATFKKISRIYQAADIKIEIDDVGSDNAYDTIEPLLPYADGLKFAMQNFRQTDHSTTQMNDQIRFWYALAQKNNLNFILEGIENQADLAIVKELGIQYVQGYYFGQPELPRI